MLVHDTPLWKTPSKTKNLAAKTQKMTAAKFRNCLLWSAKIVTAANFGLSSMVCKNRVTAPTAAKTSLLLFTRNFLDKNQISEHSQF